MKTILERKKEIVLLETPKQVKLYLEDNIIDKSVNAEYSPDAQKEIIQFANKFARMLTPKGVKKKKKKENEDQTTFLL